MSELISVIVPIYRVETYLKRCVDSIRKQTYKNIEIILVDDGSPDQCGQICDEYSLIDERVRVIHKSNGGLSDARNAGIDVARGEIISFVDSDDWLDIDMLEVLLKALHEYEADIAECSFRSIYMDCIVEETGCTADCIVEDNLFAMSSMMKWGYFKSIVWNKLYRREVLGNIRFPKGKIHEDEYTTYKYFFNASKLVYVDISKYNYNRSRTDSITGVEFREANFDACDAIRERIDFFREHHLTELEEQARDAYCWVLLDCIKRYIKSGVTSERIHKVLRQLRIDLVYFDKHPVSILYYKELVEIESNYYNYARRIKEESFVDG
ncbi:glycosyltransferase family 2 protein [Lacrimispora algidixylanolytica]|uniref:Glycosyltransferase n=1 Tax=Lacrimispora algidixylanolytica TaxID=94868 RepID=A0A419TBK7_9FIRM|nr:glycosyltransferase [Lacrimispora algidixylanolytica]RKD34843.1 glycosyltransferase [Lacrimispora algidixylanolytica]